MTELGRTLAAAASDLRELGAPFALVGGLAVSIRTEPRFTRDADFAVAVDDDEGAESVVDRLGQRGYDVIAAVEHERVRPRERLVNDHTAQTRPVFRDLLAVVALNAQRSPRRDMSRRWLDRWVCT